MRPICDYPGVQRSCCACNYLGLSLSRARRWHDPPMTFALGSEQRRLLALLAEHGQPMTVAAITAAQGRRRKHPQLDRMLARLARRGIVETTAQGWRIADTKLAG